MSRRLPRTSGRRCSTGFPPTSSRPNGATTSRFLDACARRCLPRLRARRSIASLARPSPNSRGRRGPRSARGCSFLACRTTSLARFRPTLVALLGAVALVLVIACVNVTNLLLARSAERRGELALRVALGAGRARLVRYLLIESLMLAASGGVFGWALAHAGVRALVALSPAGLPRVDAIRLDNAALIFAMVVTTATGLVVGLAPAFGTAQAKLLGAVQTSSLRATTGRHLIRRVLVVTEVALALVLLVGAGLVWRSVSQLLAVSPGFDADHLLTMQVQLVGLRYSPDPARLQFFSDALDAVRAVPGVVSAGLTSQLPLSGDFESYGVLTESTATASPDGDAAANRYVVTPDYFRTMRIPLKRGRLFDARDRPGAPEGVLVSESFARGRYPGQDPIGQRVRFGPEMSGDHPWDVIVGVVGDVKQASLALRSSDGFYVAAGQWMWVDSVQSLVVRTTGDPAGLVSAVKQAVWSVDKDQPIVRVGTMADLVDRSESQRRFALTIFRAFGGVALGLAAIGLFGVLSASVTERRREMGVRAALGASRDAIVRLVIGQGLVLTSVGAALGVIGALLGTSAIRTLLFGVSRLDAATYVGVIALLGFVSVLACWLPAWRASRVDPVITLRAE